MQFAIESPTSVHFTHINIREETHGDDKVKAVDLSMRIEAENTILDKLDPDLRAMLYCDRAAAGVQQFIEGTVAPLPHLRSPKLNDQKFAWEKKVKRPGYTMTLEYGLAGKSNIILELCTVTGFAIETKEGGTVVLGWKVQNSSDRLDRDVLGLLSELAGSDITVTLIPPTIEQLQKAGDDEDDLDAADPDDQTNPMPFDADPPGGMTAEEIFATQSTPAKPKAKVTVKKSRAKSVPAKKAKGRR